MKRLKKIVALLLCGLLCLFPTACNGSPSANGENKESSYVNLESFESYDTVSLIHCDTSIGDGSVCKDYYSEGNASFKVQVADQELYKDQLRSTTFFVPTDGEQGTYHDFSYVDQVSLDVYGVEGTDLSVGLTIALKGKNVNMVPVQNFKVELGKWTTVYFRVNRTVLNTSMDVTKISHIRISCIGVNAVICVDNLQLHKTTLGFVEAEATLDEGEFCDFEKAYQSFMVSARESLAIIPSVEVVTIPDYATSGARSLKVSSPEMNTDTTFFMTFSSKLLETSKFATLPETTYFVYDIYKPFYRKWSFTVRFLNASGAYNNMSAPVPEGIGWHTICIPLSNRVTNTSQIQFCWKSKNGLENGGKGGVTYYIDNMRFMDEVPVSGSVYVVPTNA